MNEPAESSLLFDRKPDAAEIALRAVCGALLGGLIAGTIWMQLSSLATLAIVLVFIASVGGCVWGAVRYGDDFWTGIASGR